MTGLLRDGEAHSVRRFSSAVAMPAPLDSAAPLRARLATLEATLDQAREALTAAQADAVRREDAAREAGRRAAIASDAARTEAVARGMAAAVDRLHERLASLETLAGALAIIGLEKLLGDPREHATLLAATIRHHVGALRDGSAFRVRVSRLDFGSAVADALAAAVAPLTVEIDSDLAPGEAQIELTLGAIDVSLGNQWQRLRDALLALALEA